MSTNSLVLEGNITQDPELRFGKNGGTPFVTFGIAHTPRRRNHAGEWEDGTTTFLDVIAFGRTAENVAESFSKGERVVVVGALTTDEWTNNEGERRTKIKVNADSVSGSTRFSIVTMRKDDPSQLTDEELNAEITRRLKEFRDATPEPEAD